MEQIDFKIDIIKTLLHDLYIERYNTTEITYENVDDFYGHLGYDLEFSDEELSLLNIDSTSKLLNVLKSVDNLI